MLGHGDAFDNLKGPFLNEVEAVAGVALLVREVAVVVNLWL